MTLKDIAKCGIFITAVLFPATIGEATQKDIKQMYSPKTILEISQSNKKPKSLTEIIDEKFINSLIEIESENKPYAKSKKGARGFMQIMPETLKDYNIINKTNYTIKDLYNPEINRKIGTWYLTERIPQLLKYKGLPDSLENRLLAYNWGAENLKIWIKEGKKPEKLPKESQGYLKKFEKIGVNFYR